MKKTFQRFIDIWKIDFLAKFFTSEKNDNKTTIWFWVLSNVFLVSVIAVIVCISVPGAKNDFITWIDKYVPEGARIIFTDGRLVTENIDKPFFYEISSRSCSTDLDGNFVLIIDTDTNTYDITSLDEYDAGIILFGDRAYVKGESDFKQLLFSNISNFSLSKNELIEFVEKYFVFPFAIVIIGIITLVMLIHLIVLRLVSAFWWALILFILMNIFNVRETYITAYKAVLNLYFIPTLIVLILTQMNMNMPLLTTMIFIAVFIANLVWLKRQPESSETDVIINDTKEDVTDNTVITNAAEK